MLLIHIIIALSGLGWSAYMLLNPSVRAIKISQGLLAGTLSTGTLLVVVNHASILHTCLNGLGYTAIIYAAVLLAGRRLATEKTK